MGAAREERAGARAALSDRARCCGGFEEHGDAERFSLDHATVRKWRNRFAGDRLDGLLDEPRPGRPRTVTDGHIDEVIIKTLESTPRDATHWSTRSMAAEVGLTQTAVTDLAGVWAAAAPPGDGEALKGPAVHRQGP